MDYNHEDSIKTRPSRWNRTKRFSNENRCLSLVLATGLLIFLGGFIFFACAYFVSDKTTGHICSSSDCVRAASYLLESMDLEADPCEDFYQFTCGNWHKYHIRSDSDPQIDWSDIVEKRVEHSIRDFFKSKPSANESKVIEQSRIMYKSCINAFTTDDQLIVGKELIKKWLKDFCFSYLFEQRHECKFDWNATVQMLITKHYYDNGELDYLFKSADSDAEVLQEMITKFINFLELKMNINFNIAAEMIQKATITFDEISGDNYTEKLMKMDEVDPKGLQLFIWWKIISNWVISLGYLNIDKTHEIDDDATSDNCAHLVNVKMGMFLGGAIAEPNFLNATKPKLLRIFEDIRTTFNELVENGDWMDEVTKRAVIEKANAMNVNIGFAEFLLNETKVDEYLEDLNLVGNSLLQNLHTMRKIKVDLILIEWTDWQVPESTSTEIDATYYYYLNSLLISMGILQFPFFGLGIEALNYGFGITILGHEFSHGFDDTGRIYDKNGEENDEWTDKSKNEYYIRSECLIKQYSNFNLSEVDPKVNVSVDGDKTLDENIADNVGVLLAYRAYKMIAGKHSEEEILPALQQFTSDQLFFIGFGNRWCSSVSAKSLMDWDDEHAPEKARVNGVVSNMEEFREAFKCKANSKMVSKNPCRIW